MNKRNLSDDIMFVLRAHKAGEIDTFTAWDSIRTMFKKKGWSWNSFFAGMYLALMIAILIIKLS